VSAHKKTWLVTGAAGFIGSHLLEQLLRLDQRVVAVDNFCTGSRDNLDAVRAGVGAHRFDANCSFIEGDVREVEVCEAVCQNVDYVLHQAALCSVPRSLQDPLATHDTNLTAMLNLMWACVQAGVGRFIYASSCSVYGDLAPLPHRETQAARPMSTYAVGKYAAELYAKSFHDSYQLQTIGLRYFNIFGPRQSADSAYAAVIPSFVRDIAAGGRARIYGDGEVSRDFCYVDNVVQANLLAATTTASSCFGQVFNVASGEEISIRELYRLVRLHLSEHYPEIEVGEPIYCDPRPVEIKHSRGDFSRIEAAMGYCPAPSPHEGLALTLNWYLENGRGRSAS
jgi:UDP-N-acetylglucosamine 4-epimerase